MCFVFCFFVCLVCLCVMCSMCVVCCACEILCDDIWFVLVLEFVVCVVECVWFNIACASFVVY